MIKRFIIIIVSTIIAALVLIGCDPAAPYYTEGDYYFVTRAGADMPVWVRGNTNSGVFLVFFHGGPGDSSMLYPSLPAFKGLESDYAVVYWDQRASGISQGNAQPETLTLADYILDSDLVVESVKKRYHSPKIFLMGHSWGGCLAPAYAGSSNYQTKLSGLIVVDGSDNYKKSIALAVQWIKNNALEHIAKNIDVAYWQEAYDWLNTTPDMTIPSNYYKFAPIVKKSDAYIYPPATYTQPVFNMTDAIFNSFFTLVYPLGLNGNYNYTHFNILELDITPRVSGIMIPSLFLWGRHDGMCTIDTGNEMFAAVGTPVADKSMVVFENSAHQPFLQERELFESSVRDFIEKYR
jgi:proline iminopeptidase